MTKFNWIWGLKLSRVLSKIEIEKKTCLKRRSANAKILVKKISRCLSTDWDYLQCFQTSIWGIIADIVELVLKIKVKRRWKFSFMA